jgi:hypothetical protein
MEQLLLDQQQDHEKLELDTALPNESKRRKYCCVISRGSFVLCHLLTLLGFALAIVLSEWTWLAWILPGTAAVILWPTLLCSSRGASEPYRCFVFVAVDTHLRRTSTAPNAETAASSDIVLDDLSDYHHHHDFDCDFDGGGD